MPNGIKLGQFKFKIWPNTQNRPSKIAKGLKMIPIGIYFAKSGPTVSVVLIHLTFCACLSTRLKAHLNGTNERERQRMESSIHIQPYQLSWSSSSWSSSWVSFVLVTMYHYGSVRSSLPFPDSNFNHFFHLCAEKTADSISLSLSFSLSRQESGLLCRRNSRNLPIKTNSMAPAGSKTLKRFFKWAYPGIYLFIFVLFTIQ